MSSLKQDILNILNGTDQEYKAQIKKLKLERDAMVESAGLFKAHQLEVSRQLHEAEKAQFIEEYTVKYTL